MAQYQQYERHPSELPGEVVPPATLWAGVPAKQIRPLTPEEIRLQRERTLTYVLTAARHAASGEIPSEYP